MESKKVTFLFVKIGTGIEYYHTGTKMYEGSWMSDTWNGYGKYFNIMGDLKFEGTFSDGRAAQRASKKVVRTPNKHPNNFEEITYLAAPTQAVRPP